MVSWGEIAMKYVIGVDIGTEGIKGVVLDENLQILERVYIETPACICPKPGWFEHDAEESWWGGFKKITEKLLQKICAEEIIGIGCSGLSPCLLPVDKDGRPLRNAILYGIDTRSKQEVKEMTTILGEEKILDISRRLLTTQSVGPKILWYKKNEPEKFEQTEKIFTSSNYIVYKLTGEYVIDHNQAFEFSPFYNYCKRNWDREIIRLFNIPFKLFPPLKSPFDIAGFVTQKAAEETGLPVGVPVAVSTADAFAELASIGKLNEKEAVLIYGTTGIIMLIAKEVPIVRDLYVFPYVLSNNLNALGGGMATTGALTKWFRDNFGDLEKLMEKRIGVSAYELLSKQAEKINSGSDGLIVLPYFSGERTPINDPLARGTVLGLTTRHSRAHIYRSILEGTAYGFKHHFELFSEYGLKVDRVIACGGGTKSNLWVQIVSDVIGYDQLLFNTPLGSEIGSAYFAAKATGLLDDFQVIRNTISSNGNIKRVKVDKDKHNTYEDYYKIYRKLYNNIKDDMHSLALLQEGGE